MRPMTLYEEHLEEELAEAREENDEIRAAADRNAAKMCQVARQNRDYLNEINSLRQQLAIWRKIGQVSKDSLETAESHEQLQNEVVKQLQADNHLLRTREQKLNADNKRLPSKEPRKLILLGLPKSKRNRRQRREFTPAVAAAAPPPVSKPPVSGKSRSKQFKPLLLRSKPSTEGFKMPKQRSKAPPTAQPPSQPASRSIMNSSVMNRTGRISSAVFLKRMQQSQIMAPGEESFDEVELTKERKAALVELNQAKVITLNQFLTKLKTQITKVGEGAFGEVYMGAKSDETTIIKVIPVDGEIRINDSPQKKISEVINEVIISRTLANYEGFVKCNNAALCTGVYPKALVSFLLK